MAKNEKGISIKQISSIFCLCSVELLDKDTYQPQVVLDTMSDSDSDMITDSGTDTEPESTDGELEIDLDREVEMDFTKDPDYRPLVDIFPTATVRRSQRLYTSATESSAPYSPTDDTESTLSELTVTISEPASPKYIGSEPESSDEFDSPEPIVITPKAIPVIITQDRTPSPFPIPIKLNEVALYPREQEESHLKEMTYYPKLRYWHKSIDICKCQIPNRDECLADFYFKFGFCPVAQATNFMNESPKLIIEQNSVELFNYYVANPELERLVKALHYLPRGVTDIESSCTVCKLVDSYLLMVHLDVLAHRCKIEIFATLPIDYNRFDVTILERCTATYLFIEKCLYEMVTKAKLAGKMCTFNRWISSDEIKW